MSTAAIAATISSASGILDRWGRVRRAPRTARCSLGQHFSEVQAKNRTALTLPSMALVGVMQARRWLTYFSNTMSIASLWNRPLVHLRNSASYRPYDLRVAGFTDLNSGSDRLESRTLSCAAGSMVKGLNAGLAPRRGGATRGVPRRCRFSDEAGCGADLGEAGLGRGSTKLPPVVPVAAARARCARAALRISLAKQRRPPPPVVLLEVTRGLVRDVPLARNPTDVEAYIAGKTNCGDASRRLEHTYI